MKINKVSLNGDIVQVECEENGITKIVRRHVQDYALLNDEQKYSLWNDIAGIVREEYTIKQTITDKPMSKRKFFGLFKR